MSTVKINRCGCVLIGAGSLVVLQGNFAWRVAGVVMMMVGLVLFNL